METDQSLRCALDESFAQKSSRPGITAIAWPIFNDRALVHAAIVRRWAEFGRTRTLNTQFAGEGAT